MTAKTPVPENNTGNGNTLTGWQKLVFEICRTFGVPTVILLATMYVLGWVVAPTMVDTMKKFFDATIETQKTMADTQVAIAKSQEDLADSQAQLVEVCREISTSAAKIMESEEQTEVFMETVKVDHKLQQEKLDTICETVTKSGQ